MTLEEDSGSNKCVPHLPGSSIWSFMSETGLDLEVPPERI